MPCHNSPGKWVTYKQGKESAGMDPFMEPYDKKDVAAPKPRASFSRGSIRSKGHKSMVGDVKGAGRSGHALQTEQDVLGTYRKKFGVGEEDTGFSQEDMERMYDAGVGSGGGGGGGEADAELIRQSMQLYSSQAVDPRFR